MIDMEVALAQAVQQALQQRGVAVSLLADGQEALAALRSNRPDAIILSVELGKLSGYSICNRLKKDPVLSLIPLILTSSQATAETFEQHSRLKTRAEAYISKPYSMDALLQVVNKFVPLSPPSVVGSSAPAQADGVFAQALGAPAQAFGAPAQTLGAPAQTDEITAQIDAATAETRLPAASAALAPAIPAVAAVGLPQRPAPIVSAWPPGSDGDHALAFQVEPSTSTEPTAVGTEPGFLAFDSQPAGAATVAPDTAGGSDADADRRRPAADHSPAFATYGGEATHPSTPSSPSEPPAGSPTPPAGDAGVAASAAPLAPEIATIEALPPATSPVAPPFGQQEYAAAPGAATATDMGTPTKSGPALGEDVAGAAGSVSTAAALPWQKPTLVPAEAAPGFEAAPAETSTPAETFTPAGAAPVGNDAALRRRVAALEARLASQEIDFHQRLLAESSRSGDSLPLKKQLADLQHEVGKLQTALLRCREQLSLAQEEVAQSRSQVQQERQALTQAQQQAQTLQQAGDRLQQALDLAALQQEEQASQHRAVQAQLHTYAAGRERLQQALARIAVTLQELHQPPA